MLETLQVGKRFGTEQTLDNISLSFGTGLHYIVGPSGSGKTTLLKIMCGLEQDYEGDVRYCGNRIKSLTDDERSKYYNQVFGFVWQDFQLLEEATVVENVMLPAHLKGESSKAYAEQMMRRLNIFELANRKVGSLSGGQKQRVAIARALVKKPKILIADEPTAALDKKTAQQMMHILRKLSEAMTVIVVTHDRSLIESGGIEHRLDKGKLLSPPAQAARANSAAAAGLKTSKLGFKPRAGLVAMNVKNKPGRMLATVFSLLVCSTLLLAGAAGMMGNQNQKTFDELYQTYGKAVLDIAVSGAFTGASGGNEDKPHTDVAQDISGLYGRYAEDSRVAHILAAQAFGQIRVELAQKTYEIESSNSVPHMNELIAGKLPSGEAHEVVVPKKFVEETGETYTGVLGKKIVFHGSVFNWSSGEPVGKNVSVEATIAGVADNTVTYEYEGQRMKYTVDDAFFFSKSAIAQLRLQAGLEADTVNFTMRAKSPEAMIELKNEMNAEGIVPLGQFELIEDLVRLNKQTKAQSGFAIWTICVLALLVAVAASVVTALLRQREYAIYTLCGYAKKQQYGLALLETLFGTLAAAALFYILSPIINRLSSTLLNLDLMQRDALYLGPAAFLAIYAVFALTGVVIIHGVQAGKTLQAGER